MNNTKQAVLNILQSKVDWDHFFRIVETIGDSLNGRKERFDKSDMFEEALELCSAGTVQWVDQIGWDHLVEDITQEMKSQKHCLYTPTGTLKKNSAPIKLMNSLGTAANRTIEEVIRFSHLLIVDTGSRNSFAAAIVAKEDIREEWLDFKTDGVILKVPTMHLDFVVRPTEMSVGEAKQSMLSYQQEKRKLQRKFLESI